MSWFFGKKKHRESPPETPEEPPAPPDDEYIFVEKRNQSGPNSDDKTPGLYPSLNNINSYPAMPTALVKQNSQESHSSDLSNIPFKLCKELERNMNDDLLIDKLRLDEILNFIKRVKVENYDYEFSLERSVIAEMNSQNQEE